MLIRAGIKTNSEDAGKGRVIDLDTGEPILFDGLYQWEIAVHADGRAGARLTLKDLPVIEG
jgi:hypothetical protein